MLPKTQSCSATYEASQAMARPRTNKLQVVRIHLDCHRWVTLRLHLPRTATTRGSATDRALWLRPCPRPCHRNYRPRTFAAVTTTREALTRYVRDLPLLLAGLGHGIVFLYAARALPINSTFSFHFHGYTLFPFQRYHITNIVIKTTITMLNGGAKFYAHLKLS